MGIVEENGTRHFGDACEGKDFVRVAEGMSFESATAKTITIPETRFPYYGTR